MNEEIRNQELENNENLENVAETTSQPEPIKQTMIIAKIVVGVLTVLAMGFLLYLDVSVIIDMQDNGWAALGWAVICVVYAPLLCGTTFIVSIINMFRAIGKIKKNLITKGTLIYFIVFTVIPVLFFIFTIWGVQLIV